MKVLVFMSVLLCVALSVRAAVVRVEEEKNAPIPEDTVEVNEIPVENLEVVEVKEVEEETENTPQIYSVSEAEVGLEMAVQPEDRFAFCPDGWFQHQSRCYLYVNTPMKWHSAEDHCNQLQASLASVQNPQEYRFLQQMITTGSQSTAWLGGFYLQTQWRWIDRQGLYYINWYSTPSSSSAASYPCMYMRDTLGWSNSACSTSRRFVCTRNRNC